MTLLLTDGGDRIPGFATKPEMLRRTEHDARRVFKWRSTRGSFHSLTFGEPS